LRPPIRLAAMMGLHVIYVFTHDSIASVRSRRHKIFQSLPSFVIQLSERFLFIVHSTL
jgi:hypothetical protein